MEYKDGQYNIKVELSGGDGTESIQTPTSFEIEDGEMTATVIWKDSDVDTMTVNGVEYAPVKDGANPTFKVVIPELDKDIDVFTETVTGTVAVTEDYTLNFKSDSLTKLQGSLFSSEIILIFLVLAVAGIGERIISGMFKSKRGNKNSDGGVIESEATVIDEEE